MEVLSLGVGHLNIGNYHLNNNSIACATRTPLINPTDQGPTSRKKADQSFEPETEHFMSTMTYKNEI